MVIYTNMQFISWEWGPLWSYYFDISSTVQSALATPWIRRSSVIYDHYTKNIVPM